MHNILIRSKGQRTKDEDVFEQAMITLQEMAEFEKFICHCRQLSDKP